MAENYSAICRSNKSVSLTIETQQEAISGCVGKVSFPPIWPSQNLFQRPQAAYSTESTKIKNFCNPTPDLWYQTVAVIIQTKRNGHLCPSHEGICPFGSSNISLTSSILSVLLLLFLLFLYNSRFLLIPLSIFHSPVSAREALMWIESVFSNNF